ncbi:MAG: hypothetical protein NTZ10_05685 [Candidatus Saganbacteria bacterium]|nr:hypothetical protein [Candidatus Saganbacteria bacterium]
MKKVLFAALAVSFIIIGLSAVSQAATPGSVAVPVGESMSKATLVTQVDLPALMNRKTYRLGVRGGLISVSDTTNIQAEGTATFGFDFDAKLNENLDTGPRFTYIWKRYNNGTTVNGSYGIMAFGYGARIYVTYWGDYGSTHGYLNAYLTGDINYCAANRLTDSRTGGSPSSFSGFAANAGAGIEAAFGPNTTGFVELKYQKSGLRDSNNVELPLDGFVFNLGTRLAFF